MLYIPVTPIISVNCSNPTTVNQSDYFACECKGTDGKPLAKVTWYKNNTQIITGKENANLVLTNVDKDDSGTYRCVAKNHEEAVNETSMELIVNCEYDRILIDQACMEVFKTIFIATIVYGSELNIARAETKASREKISN